MKVILLLLVILLTSLQEFHDAVRKGILLRRDIYAVQKFFYPLRFQISLKFAVFSLGNDAGLLRYDEYQSIRVLGDADACPVTCWTAACPQ